MRKCNSVQQAVYDLFDAICGCQQRVWIVPHLGIAVEQTQPVLKTPQFQSCKTGEVIMAFDLAATQQVPVSVAFTDKKGNPAPVDGVPTWSTDNSEVLALTPAADGLSCVVAAVGPLGSATVTLQADADLGEGVVSIVGSLSVNVTAGSATVVALTPGVPEEQP